MKSDPQALISAGRHAAQAAPGHKQDESRSTRRFLAVLTTDAPEIWKTNV